MARDGVETVDEGVRPPHSTRGSSKGRGLVGGLPWVPGPPPPPPTGQGPPQYTASTGGPQQYTASTVGPSQYTQPIGAPTQITNPSGGPSQHLSSPGQGPHPPWTPLPSTGGMPHP